MAMVLYLLRRSLTMALTLLAISALVFIVINIYLIIVFVF